MREWLQDASGGALAAWGPVLRSSLNVLMILVLTDGSAPALRARQVGSE